jgi:hypothetical protein
MEEFSVSAGPEPRSLVYLILLSNFLADLNRGIYSLQIVLVRFKVLDWPAMRSIDQ